jgi:hypothetical protein
MKMKLTKLFTAFAVTLCAASANAGTVSVGTAQSDASVACAGCIANDISINFDGNLRGQQLWVNLTSGSVYNTPATGAETSPADAFIGLVPELAFDSFVTVGGLTSGSSQGVLVVGGAVDIPGAPSAKGGVNQEAGATSVSIAWAPGTGVNVPRGTYHVDSRCQWRCLDLQFGFWWRPGSADTSLGNRRCDRTRASFAGFGGSRFGGLGCFAST